MMRVSLLVATVLSAVAAATSPEDCAGKCLVDASASADCAANDVACLCGQDVLVNSVGGCIVQQCGSDESAFEAAFQQAGLFCTGLDKLYREDVSVGRARKRSDLTSGSYEAYDTTHREGERVAIKSWNRFWTWWAQQVYHDGKWHLGKKGWNYLKHRPGWMDWQAFWLTKNDAWQTWSANINEPSQPQGELKRRNNPPGFNGHPATTTRPHHKKPQHTTKPSKQPHTTTHKPATTTKPSTTTSKPVTTTSKPVTTTTMTTSAVTSVTRYSTTAGSSLAYF